MDLNTELTKDESSSPAKDATVLRVLVALYQNPLSWTDLLERTSLSRSTLSSVLDMLKNQRIVSEELRRAGSGRGRPNVIYSLNENSLKKAKQFAIPPVIREFREIEKKANELTSLSIVAVKQDPSSIQKISQAYLENSVKACLVIFEAAILYEVGSPPYQEVVANEAFSSIRRILWDNDFARQFQDLTNKELRQDKDDNIRELESGIKKLKGKIKDHNKLL